MATKTKKEAIYVERVMWETIRRDCKLPESDQNEGLIYGLHFTDFEGEGDIYEVMWFKTGEEREKCIVDENAIVIFD